MKQNTKQISASKSLGIKARAALKEHLGIPSDVRYVIDDARGMYFEVASISTQSN
jgi:hypothetical protein